MVELNLPSDPSSIVDSILMWAVEAQGTDIHFSPLSGRMSVRVRIDGDLREICTLDPEVFRKVISRIKVLAEIDIAEKRRPQDGRFSRLIDDREVDFRVSLLPVFHEESVALRILDRKSGLRTIDQLGLSRREAGVFRSLISNPSGLVVSTGPTNAGKTTTLYSALHELATPERNLVTIEDPIEYEIDGVLQTATRIKLGLNFATLLRSILRHDPDVIVIGEVRDAETAQIAVRAALTGHLVLTSLHTQKASDSVSALLQLGIEPYALAPSLKGVVAQQLVRMICPDCKTTFEYGDDILSDPDLSSVMQRGETPSFSIGMGCEKCFQIGYRGRCAIFEIMEVNERIRECIYRGEMAAAIEQVAVESGMFTLRQRGFRSVLEGITTVEEVVRAVPIE